jgi:hypothetical protein
MGFTNVAWESRSTEQLARDLTDGPGPGSVGQAGAAWVRVADELASVSEEYGRVVDALTRSFSSQGADAAARRLIEFGQWLEAASLSAAGNGQRAEQAAVATSVAVLAMPTVSEAVEAQTTHDIMASLAAYNGAILDGRFVELDEAANAAQADASAVMYTYEQSCDGLAVPWDQPMPPDVSNGAALKAEEDAKKDCGSEGGGSGAGKTTGGHSAIAAPVPPPPRAPFKADSVASNARGASPVRAAAVAGAGASGAGGLGGYGPMAGLARADSSREHESSVPASTLAGGGETSAGLSGTEGSWLPAAARTDAPFTVSSVSWGPATTVFDELAGPESPELPAYADEPQGPLHQLSDRWVAHAVIGSDRGASA